MEPRTAEPKDLNTLIQEYKAGSEDAAVLLINRFENYLRKWSRLLTSGTWNKTDTEVTSFLRMMGSVDTSATAQILCKRLRAYDKEDVEQEVKVALLETVIRYGTVVSHYRYVLKRRLVELTKDPVVFSGYANIDLLEVEAQVFCPDINESWVEGLTCSGGFIQLSRRERRILQLVFWFGKTEEQTAEELCCSRSTVSRALRRARRVLKAHYLG